VTTIDKSKFIIGYRYLNKLSKCKIHKKSYQFVFNNNVVYKISCNDRVAYVEQKDN